MSNEHPSTTSRQLCDTTTSSQQLTPFPETDQQPTDGQTTATTTSSTSSTSSTTRARARAREDHFGEATEMVNSTTRARARAREGCELPPIERLHQTRDLYESSVGRMTPIVGQHIERYLQAGMEIDVIDHAIAETAWARRPSANYLFAILRRYFDSEIFTFDTLMDDVARHEADKQARQARRAARWYDEDDPDPIWF